MLIVWEYLDLGDAAGVFFEMRDEFTGSDFPYSDIAFHASGAEEFTIMREANCCNASFVSVVDLPELRAVVGAVCPDAAVGPSAENDLFGECRTVCIDTGTLGN